MTMLALILLVALVATLGLREIFSLDALAPAITTMLFVLSAATGLVALAIRRHAARTRILDTASVLTFVGVLISIMIESDQMTRLMTLSETPD